MATEAQTLSREMILSAYKGVLPEAVFDLNCF